MQGVSLGGCEHYTRPAHIPHSRAREFSRVAQECVCVYAQSLLFPYLTIPLALQSFGRPAESNTLTGTGSSLPTTQTRNQILWLQKPYAELEVALHERGRRRCGPLVKKDEYVFEEDDARNPACSADIVVGGASSDALRTIRHVTCSSCLSGLWSVSREWSIRA